MAEPGRPGGPAVGIELAGDGFVLRRWRPDDLEALLKHADDARVSSMLSERFPHPYTRADGEDFLGGRVVDLGQPVLAIVIDGEAAGGIGLRRGSGERAHSAELGYWLGHAHWGRGLMTAAVSLLVPWAMREWRLSRVHAFALAHNQASARVRSNAGSKKKACSAARWSRTATHWTCACSPGWPPPTAAGAERRAHFLSESWTIGPLQRVASAPPAQPESAAWIN
jgi:RimJ/RimL family protein N-acetyltransferase